MPQVAAVRGRGDVRGAARRGAEAVPVFADGWLVVLREARARRSQRGAPSRALLPGAGCAHAGRGSLPVARRARLHHGLQMFSRKGTYTSLKDRSTSSSSSSSAHYSPLLGIGLSNFWPSRSIFGYAHPAPASCPAQIVTPPGLRASYTTFT
jgi:hypothetical protein